MKCSELSPALQEALQWVENSWTLADMGVKLRLGLCSQRAYDWYVLFWTWSAARYGCHRHDRFYDRRGDRAYWRRINRVRAFITRHSRLKLDPYPETVLQ